MKKSLCVLIALAVFSMTFAACSPAGGLEDSYIIGINAEYQPFEWVDEAGNIVGFDVDLWDALAEEMGIEYEWVNTKWDGIFVALQSGEFDAVISAASIYPERLEIVNFSDPYFEAGQQIVVRVEDKDVINTKEHLDGLKVGVMLGTTGDIWVSEETAAEVSRYDEITLAFQALANGDVDAVVNDNTNSIELIQANPDMNLTLVGVPYTAEDYGIAVIKEKPELLEAINKALATIKENGTYDKIYDDWFGIE
ncbi:MAG: basic amino acid ABC transporter substrate-binding protein [Anaerolineaceae bacterium]|nr:basic amino acid ABC transporter substrate-binding protein [Anaerolineaceae bacterium]